jgi:hypothetical protein
MTTPTRPTRLAAFAIAAALLVSCSSSGSDDAAPSTTEADVTTTTEEATTTTEEETTTTEAAGGDDELTAQLAAFLVTADDLGPTFTEREPSTGDAGPCGVSVDSQFPPELKAQVAFQSDELELAMQQDLRVFATEEDASAAFDGFVEAVSCGDDTADPESLQLGEPTDVTDQVGQKAVAVALTGDGTEGVGVVVIYSDLIATYQFQGTTGAADAADVGSPLELAAANVQEIVDEIG